MLYNFIISCILSFSFLFNSVYDFNVPLIEGGNTSLSNFSSKKILIVILPVHKNVTTDSLLYSIDTIAQAHSNNLKVIAVPAYEDGFTDLNKNTLKNWYRSKLNNSILVTDGLYTRTSSGTLQHGLFKWLTHVEENNIFNVTITGPDHKFFINEEGELYGNLTNYIRTWSPTVFKTITLP